MSNENTNKDSVEGEIHNIGLISDTHVPVRTKKIPSEALEYFRENHVELILHAGDLVTMDVLDELKVIAPVVAVHGNMCYPDVERTLPAYTTIEINNIVIGLTHGSGGPIGYVDRMLYIAKERKVNVLVSGHTHSPYIKKKEGILLVNPGSASGNIDAVFKAKKCSVGLLKIKGMDIDAEIYRF